MSKQALDHHQKIVEKTHHFEQHIRQPLTDLITAAQNLAQVLSNKSPAANTTTLEDLIEKLTRLSTESDALLACYHQARANLLVTEDDSDIEETQEQALLQELKKVLEQSVWEKSKFYESIKLAITAMLDHFEEMIGIKRSVSGKRLAELASEHLDLSIDADKLEIFISLHNSRGGQENALPSWENLLATIGAQVINRPIYNTEKDVQSFIRSAKEPSNEAYVCAIIHTSDLMSSPNGQTKKDREGRPMLVVKEGAVHKENIQRFVHLSGIYHYKHDKLVRHDDASSPD